jgi:UDP-N-acetylmuramyl pentapeptide phosphotransferase/UDP-N-acetylglucosamine-1-phosphate transferase
VIIFNNLYLELIFLIFSYGLINWILKTNFFLIDKTESSIHKKKIFNNLNIPLSGGLFFIIFTSIYFFQYYSLLILFLILIYLIGILSDLNLVKSPTVRLIIQTSIVLLYIFFSNTKIISINISFLDVLLRNFYFNLIFVTFCVLIIINGYNFIDGINTLATGNFIICIISIIFVSNINNLNLDKDFILPVLSILIVIFIFNFFGKSFLGDSGAYAISFFISIVLIHFYFENYGMISPYYIASLIWYPALENLFSIIRRKFNKKTASQPDNKHFHQLLYSYLLKKISLKNKFYLNSVTGMLINFYMLGSSIIAFNIYTHTVNLVILILANVTIYFLVYFYLYKK